MPALRNPKTGRFYSKVELEQLNQEQQENSTMSNVETIEAPVFVDEVPTVKRGSRDSGVWAKRLAPLLEVDEDGNEVNRGRWAKVYGPTNNPHATINNVRQGNAAGVDSALFSFKGRIEGKTTEVDEDGNEKEVNLGYVYARYDTDEQRSEREAAQAKRAASRAKSNGHTDEDDDEYDDE